MQLDRAPVDRRSAAWVEARFEDPAARAVAVTAGGVWIDPSGVEPSLWVVHPRDIAGELVLLGVDGSGPIFAIDAEGREMPEAAQVAGLRDVFARLHTDMAGLAAHASALLNWHRAHQFCSRCGASTSSEAAGHSRRCPACGAEHFPRTDPVVIVRVTYEDRLLLVHQFGWPEGRFSVPAGFVEPGETLEDAVRRELLEETAVSVTNCTYLSSQPWPFPTSLMLGFAAEAVSEHVEADEFEIEEARWFTRSELLAAGDALPGRYSISRRLIDGWLAGD